MKALTGAREDGEAAKEVRAVKEEWLREWMPKLTSDETPINPYRVIWDLAQAIDRKQAVVTHDSGSPRDQMIPFFEAVVPPGVHRVGEVNPAWIRLGAGHGGQDGRSREVGGERDG